MSSFEVFVLLMPWIICVDGEEMFSTALSAYRHLSGCLNSCFLVLQEGTLHASYDEWALSLISYGQSPNRSDALIQWAAEHFPRACFLMYEQVHPEDPFGHVMQQHFRQLNTALHSLAQYADCEAQQRRFLGKVSTSSSRVSTKHDLSEEDGNTKCLVSDWFSKQGWGWGTAFSGSVTHH